MSGVLAIMLGLAQAWAQAPDPTDPLDQAVDLVQSRLPDQIDDDQLLLAALRGITDHLNQQLGAPAHGVLTAAEYAQRNSYLQGQREGLGTLYQIIPGQGLMLDHVFRDGPADRAGLSRGDLIVAINNHPFTGLSNTDIFHLASTEALLPIVTLDIRQGTGTTRFEVERGPYQVPSVSPHPDADGCIEVLFFGVGAAQALRDQLATLDPADGVLLDLRNNQGGVLAEAVAAASLFLDDRAVVTIQRSADGSEETQLATGSPIWRGRVVILMNEQTAGAAEAFTAALHEHQVAQTSGTQSAGLAREPGYYVLNNAMVLQLADTTLRAPSGQTWDGQGLIPDVWVEPVTDSPSGVLPDVQLRIASGLLREP